MKAAARAGGKSLREQLQSQLAAAVKRGDMAESLHLVEEMQKLGAEVSPPTLSIGDTRKLLRIETASVEAEGRTARLLLTPHHPLVLRQRLLTDILLVDVIRMTWGLRWPVVAYDELQEFLSGWALPEPQHAYGVQGPEPLVFDGWVSGYAVYGNIDSGRETDAQSLGVRSVRDVIRRYIDLYPTAADRLRLSFQGDNAGRWAWEAMADRLGAGRLHADIDIITPLPSREPTDFEHEALASGDGLSMFEPGPNGEAPAFRVRRVDPAGLQMVTTDLKLVVADRLSAFQASWGDDATHRDDLDPWDSSLLFYEPLAETVDYRVRIGERPDAHSTAVSLAVSRAANRDAVLRETYNFDPRIIEPTLRSQQARTNWLVLVSRYPAYRAVQACADAVALLDFSSRVEGGRPVHVSVSIGKDRQDQCVRYLGERLRHRLGRSVRLSG